MKKLLSILGAIGLVATSSATVVACESDPISESDKDNSETLLKLFPNINIKVSSSEDLKKPLVLNEEIDKQNSDSLSKLMDAANSSNSNAEEQSPILFHFEDAKGNEIKYDGTSETVETEISKIYIEFSVSFTLDVNDKSYDIETGDAISFTFSVESLSSFGDLFKSSSLTITSSEPSEFLTTILANTYLSAPTENCGYDMAINDNNGTDQKENFQNDGFDITTLKEIVYSVPKDATLDLEGTSTNSFEAHKGDTFTVSLTFNIQ